MKYSLLLRFTKADRERPYGQSNKEMNTWVFKVDKVVEVDTTGARERCTRLFARIVKKNVKSRLNQEKTVRFIARIVSQSIKTAANF